jgi:hypothetical protein
VTGRRPVVQAQRDRTDGRREGGVPVPVLAEAGLSAGARLRVGRGQGDTSDAPTDASVAAGWHYILPYIEQENLYRKMNV